MDYKKLLDAMKRFGSKQTDICMHGIGVPPDVINTNVVIAPWWEPPIFADLGNAQYLSESNFSATKVWNIVNDNLEFTYIKTGIGAPVLMDAILSLGVTKCKDIIFIGSVGSLDENISIGDIVIPEWSICGDGASRYIFSNSLKSNDVFGEKAYPNKELYIDVIKNTKNICVDNNVKYHIGKTFSTDTIFAQFAHIDEIIDMECNVIEMETAAAFRAAALANIPIAAIFSVSDNTITNKSLISGRSESELEYRRFTRKTIFPRIILKTFSELRTK